MDETTTITRQRDRNGLEILSTAECLGLLRDTPVGRVVFTDRALPAVRPVNFVLHNGQIIMRTSGRGVLSAALNGSVVAFEADDCTEPEGAWSVTLVGTATVPIDAEQRRELDHLGIQSWTPIMRGSYVVIDIETISGRRIPHGARDERLGA